MYYFHSAQSRTFYGSSCIRYGAREKEVETHEYATNRVRYTQKAMHWDFFESLYSGWLELRENHRLYLHFIISRNKNGGNTQALIRQWLVQGYDVRVVMPRPVMQHILDKLHFVPAMESLPEWYDEIVECWRRPKAWLLPACLMRRQAQETG